jgi:ABC-type bacteriocin/lantibiotic exporter with double-glycine peptidase domain
MLSIQGLRVEYGARVLFNDLSFTVQPRERIAFAGHNGAGKSTLMKCVAGIIQPTAGKVTAPKGHRIGYLPQEVVLFPGTVAENIARMQAPEDLTDAVIEAAKQAHAHEMILKLPKGYATLVGEGGNRLSGGQRQLVGLLWSEVTRLDWRPDGYRVTQIHWVVPRVPARQPAEHGGPRGWQIHWVFLDLMNLTLWSHHKWVVA